ncbi:MAG: hypothetical protein D6714_20270, partial [Bacteroidetes bacterium]
MIRFTPTLSALLLAFSLLGQPDFSAHDTIPPYDGNFGFGVNPGAYNGWTDDQLADIAAGNPLREVVGLGANTFRPTLPEHFLEFWGYDIRLDVFRHYQELGMKNVVVFVGYPSEAHRENESHCPGARSETFANLYEPIWDDGANDTPVNDDNYFALYLYKTVTQYHPYVKIWEIWNEPDFSFNIHSITPPGTEGSWWDENPSPCDHAFRAPVTHYIRMLRIAYEVIKSIDPNAFIATGGLGYPSYLDAILRNSDNPDSGKITDAYPLPGGAYIDIVSFHSYPHIDGSMRAWSDEVHDFVYFRNSDSATAGVVRLFNEFKIVCEQYGYDGVTYPAKKWIITETNIPRVPFQYYIGSEEAQVNFILKTIVACMKNGLLQLHPYSLSDIGDFQNPKNEFETMGLYRNLNDTPPYEQRMTDAGKAYMTATSLLSDAVFDAEETSRLQLPDTVDGGAFRKPDEQYVYVLWAKTTGDQSEKAAALYAFPPDLDISFVEVCKWNSAYTGKKSVFAANTIHLTGSPVFIQKA